MVGRKSAFSGEREASRRIRSVVWAALAILLAGAVLLQAGCKKAEQKVVREKAVNVRVLPAESRSLQPYVESVGTLKPYEEVAVSSELDGILETIKVEEGTVVGRGELIAGIKATDYQLAVEQAEAILKQAQASLANVQEEHKRKEALYRESLVTKQQFDDVVARLAVAGGDVERAKAGLDLAKEKLAKTKIYAPMAGSIKEKRATVGDYIRNGTLLVSLIRTDLLKLDFSVSEKDVASLRVGQQATFTIDAFPNREFQGRLQKIFPHLDEKTRSLQVEAEVPNAHHELRPGFYARVTLFTGPARATVVVPINALLYDNSEIKLFVVEDNKARERKVKVGRKYGEFMEITEGAKAQEMVVTVGQNNLMEGALVNVAR